MNFTSHAECIVDLVYNMLSDQRDWYNIGCELSNKEHPMVSPFDKYGNYRHRESPTAIDHLTGDAFTELDAEQLEVSLHSFRETFRIMVSLNDFTFSLAVDDASHRIHVTPPIESSAKSPDYEKFRPYFLHVPAEKVRKTFEATTQFAGKSKYSSDT
jgi:hypothetical protein